MKVKIETTCGDIIVELYPDKVPLTVDNFVQYITERHYDNTIFHRVIKGFMIQGGGFTEDMAVKPTRAAIKNEANNGLKNELGTIAMARTQIPHSASAQFFINTEDNLGLDFQAETVQGWGYCVFGKVAEGMDTVYAIEEVATQTYMGHNDVPKESIVISGMSVVDGK